jgi:membrane-associated protease RseP (regulator of RpoE activity)
MNPEERPSFPEQSEPERVWGFQRQLLQEMEPPRPRLLLHLVLFLATLATTITAGALQQGVNPLTHPYDLYMGVPFSITLLLILGTHEMGHYLVSRRHHLNVTLPYFIPAPPFPFIIGTFGAFIRIRSPIQDKKALLDVG